MHRTIGFLVGALAIVLTLLLAQDQKIIDQITRVLPPDGIPAIHAPTFTPVAEADGHFYGDEIVIGVVGETEQREYSTWQLDRHETVNDVFEGQPIAVTW
jgi:hypothetical protein